MTKKEKIERALKKLGAVEDLATHASDLAYKEGGELEFNNLFTAIEQVEANLSEALGIMQEGETT